MVIFQFLSPSKEGLGGAYLQLFESKFATTFSKRTTAHHFYCLERSCYGARKTQCRITYLIRHYTARFLGNYSDFLKLSCKSSVSTVNTPNNGGPSKQEFNPPSRESRVSIIAFEISNQSCLVAKTL